MDVRKFLAPGLLGVTALIGSSGALADATDPRISVGVIAVPGNEQVTLSRPASSTGDALVTYAGYRGTISNGTTNTLNRVFLKGVATTVGGSDNPVFDSSIPAGACSAGATANSVKCSLPSIAPGGADDQVIVIFKAPQSGTQINFAWTGGGFEGKGSGTGCCSVSGTAATTLVDPSTDTSYTTKASSFVPPAGGKFLTGSEAIPTTGDGWSTIVKVNTGFTSPYGDYTLATIVESSNADDPTLSCPSWALASTCFQTALTIPGTFGNLLEITFRLDNAYFSNSVRPETLTLRYTGDALPVPAYVTYPHLLLLCADDLAYLKTNGYPSLTAGDLPLVGRPCMSELPKVYKNNYSIRDLRGVLEFNVLARDNGKYSP